MKTIGKVTVTGCSHGLFGFLAIPDQDEIKSLCEKLKPNCKIESVKRAIDGAIENARGIEEIEINFKNKGSIRVCGCNDCIENLFNE